MYPQGQFSAHFLQPLQNSILNLYGWPLTSGLITALSWQKLQQLPHSKHSPQLIHRLASSIASSRVRVEVISAFISFNLVATSSSFASALTGSSERPGRGRAAASRAATSRARGPLRSKARANAPLRQSSRWTRSLRSCRSWASSDRVAMGRASRRLSEIGSPVSSQ